MCYMYYNSCLKCLDLQSTPSLHMINKLATENGRKQRLNQEQLKLAYNHKSKFRTLSFSPRYIYSLYQSPLSKLIEVSAF